MANYGIPYMGSKDSIIHKIAKLFPKADHFYDLFGGGFSVSHFMTLHFSSKYKHIYYNEIQSDLVELVQKAIRGEFNYNVFKPEWISREEFFRKKDSCAYTRIIWSFGNNQKNYLFGPDIELQKKSLHNAVVFNQFDNTAVKLLGIRSFPGHLSIRGRRLACRQLLNKRMDLLQQQQIERIERLQQLEQIERIERLQQLEQLQQVEQVQRLNFSSLSYDQVEILPNSVIYCDPPYIGTAEYLQKFDHTKFWAWVRKQSSPVFVSEYKAPPDFKPIMAIEKQTRLSAKGKTDTHAEKVFGNEAAWSYFK